MKVTVKLEGVEKLGQGLEKEARKQIEAELKKHPRKTKNSGEDDFGVGEINSHITVDSGLTVDTRSFSRSKQVKKKQ